MRHCLQTAVAACVIFTVCSVFAQDIPTRALKYFPGKWQVKSADSNFSGVVQWDGVAGGKAIAGSLIRDDGVKSYTLAGWDLAKKTWRHSWFASDGSSGHLEINRFENDTYIGTGHVVDAEGNTVSGEWRNKIIDQNHFEITQETDKGPIVSQWERIN